MLILAIVAAIAAVGIAARWYLHRFDALGRPRRFPTISVSLLTVLAVVLAVPTFLRSREEAKLNKVASTLVGAPVTVHCQTFGGLFTNLAQSGDLGYVRFGADGVPQHHATIQRGPCADLKRYYDGGQAHPNLSEIIAVHVLTHESMHMRGQTNEADTDCEAMQRDAETAQLLGATPQEGLALARAYWLEVYPNMPDNYRSGDCKLGGSLDESLPDPPWTSGSYPAVILPAAG